jgi:hypothetical protein
MKCGKAQEAVCTYIGGMLYTLYACTPCDGGGRRDRGSGWTMKKDGTVDGNGPETGTMFDCGEHAPFCYVKKEETKYSVWGRKDAT